MIKNIIFDADGTLFHTNYLFLEAFYELYQKLGLPIPKKKIHPTIGMGSERAIPVLTSPAWFKKNGARCIRLGGELYMRKYLKRAHPFPYAQRLCWELTACGKNLALASSSSQKIIRYYLNLLDGQKLFRVVVTANDIKNSKPAPDIFLSVLRKGNFKREETCVVGDSIWDMQAAKKAKLKALGVLSGGYYSAKDLKAEGALEVYRDVGELYRKLKTSFIMKDTKYSRI